MNSISTTAQADSARGCSKPAAKKPPNAKKPAKWFEDGGGFFTIPTRVAFGWAPKYLFGLGAMAWGGVELAQWLANYGEERESYLDYFDYGAGGTLVVDTPYVRPSLYFGWMNTNIYWDDRVANHQGYEGRVGLDIVWEDF